MRSPLRRWKYEGVSTSAFRNVVMMPLNLNGIMAIFWKAEVDSPTYCQFFLVHQILPCPPCLPPVMLSARGGGGPGGSGGGGSGGGRGQGTFHPPYHVLHYHMVLRPEGTSHNKSSFNTDRCVMHVHKQNRKHDTGLVQLTKDKLRCFCVCAEELCPLQLQGVHNLGGKQKCRGKGAGTWRPLNPPLDSS